MGWIQGKGLGGEHNGIYSGELGGSTIGLIQTVFPQLPTRTTKAASPPSQHILNAEQSIL